MYDSLDGRSVIVTGAAQGIGKATASAFARVGAKVVVADVDVGRGRETTDEITSDGATAIFVPCDVADESAVEELIRATLKAFGRLDCAFNNAGVQIEGNTRTADLAVETFDKTLAINARGVFLGMKHEINAMLAEGDGGAIVNTASTAGLRGRAGSPAYVASKFAVVGMTCSAAIEYGDAGIRVNAVCPGPTKTELLERLLTDPETIARVNALTLLGRVGAPADIAAAVLWLCSSEASFITGQALGVDGGFLNVPPG